MKNLQCCIALAADSKLQASEAPIEKGPYVEFHVRGVYIHLHEWMLFIRWIRRYCTYASLMSHGSVIVMSNQSYVVIVCYFVWSHLFGKCVFYWVVLSLFIWVTTSSQLPSEPKKKFCDLWSFVTSLSPTYSAWHIPCFHLSLCQC